mmetsp:Transcript_8322/g.17339  ORF Transcript_8322/g.17339 Transcript_8322/m.17339 type:complete len:89 (+) Transcript_8322:11-277(+)
MIKWGILPSRYEVMGIDRAPHWLVETPLSLAMMVSPASREKRLGEKSTSTNPPRFDWDSLHANKVIFEEICLNLKLLQKQQWHHSRRI